MRYPKPERPFVLLTADTEARIGVWPAFSGRTCGRCGAPAVWATKLAHETGDVRWSTDPLRWVEHHVDGNVYWRLTGGRFVTVCEAHRHLLLDVIDVEEERTLRTETEAARGFDVEAVTSPELVGLRIPSDPEALRAGFIIRQDDWLMMRDEQIGFDPLLDSSTALWEEPVDTGRWGRDHGETAVERQAWADRRSDDAHERQLLADIRRASPQVTSSWEERLAILEARDRVATEAEAARCFSAPEPMTFDAIDVLELFVGDDD